MTKKSTYRIDDVATAFQCDPEREEIISALAERDYRVFEVEQPVGALVPYHTHDEEETLIVIGGRIQFNVEEELIPLEKGDILVINAGAIHAAATVGKKPAKLLIAFEGEGGGPARDTDYGEEEEEDFEIG